MELFRSGEVPHSRNEENGLMASLSTILEPTESSWIGDFKTNINLIYIIVKEIRQSTQRTIRMRSSMIFKWGTPLSKKDTSLVANTESAVVG